VADLCCVYTFAGITINDFDSDGLVLGDDGVTGLDGAPIRSQVDPRGQIDGGIVHTKFFGPRIITFNGFVNIQSVPIVQSAIYFEALNDVEAAVVAALEGALNTPSNLAWTPTGQAARTLSCTYGTTGGEIAFAGSMLEKTFTFQLVAEDPEIS
jgi:hypothetical protein